MAGVRPLLRACLPREHSLWVWGGAPLLAALLLAPRVGTAAGALAIGALFAAGNAWRAGARQLVALCAGLAALMAALTAWWAVSPWWWAISLFGGLSGVIGAILATEGRFGRAIAQHTRLELLAIGGSLLVGATLALAGGAGLRRVILVAALLWTWQVIGLWWVRGQLARVLVGRAPWAEGPWVWAPSWLALGLLGAAWAAPWVAAIPLGYGLRARLTAPAASGRDVKRIGLSEAAWTTLVVVLGWPLVG